MPKKTRKDYPENWEEIAWNTKKRDGFTCQKCKLVFAKRYEYFCERLKPRTVNGKRIVLTVHHKDRNTRNNSDGNLISLCSACHCREELPLIRKEIKEKKLSREIEIGQMFLQW